MGWCSKKLHQNSNPGWLVFSLLRWGSMGWCSKSWGGVPKSCPRIPTLYTTQLHTEWPKLHRVLAILNRFKYWEVFYSCHTSFSTSCSSLYVYGVHSHCKTNVTMMYVLPGLPWSGTSGNQFFPGQGKVRDFQFT